MKLDLLKKKLIEKNKKNNVRIKKEYKKDDKEKKTISDMKVIGITGSRGKSTTALIIHNYLKSLGYKSILYSSVMVDSPASYKNKNESCEVSFNSEEELLNIILEAEAYEADYLILEVNESTINKGITKNIPFDIRVLTNINPKHNLQQYTEEKYVELKKSFFSEVKDECKNILCFQDYEKDLLEKLLKLNKYPKYITTSRYIASLKNIKEGDINCLLTALESDINGMTITFRINDSEYTIKTRMIMTQNVFNILTAITTLNSLGILDIKKFEESISNLVVPGRAQVIKVNNKYVIIDTHLPSMLDFLKSLKAKGIINKINVVVGSIGYGYIDWQEQFKTDEFILQRKKVRKYAMNLLKEVADHVYLTESDSGKEKTLDICEEMKSYLNEEVPCTIIVNRKKAIIKAIEDSCEKDVILISGRGNRRVMCNSENTMKLLLDSEVVEDEVKKLKK